MRAFKKSYCLPPEFGAFSILSARLDHAMNLKLMVEPDCSSKSRFNWTSALAGSGPPGTGSGSAPASRRQGAQSQCPGRRRGTVSIKSRAFLAVHIRPLEFLVPNGRLHTKRYLRCASQIRKTRLKSLNQIFLFSENGRKCEAVPARQPGKIRAICASNAAQVIVALLPA